MTAVSTNAGPQIDSAVEGARAWLSRSGIQAGSGGCHAWFDADGRCYEALYPEVTGYYSTLGAWLGGELLQPGKRAADWLAELVLPDGGFRCVIPDGDSPAPASESFRRKKDRRYTFDAGIVLQGLVATVGATDKARSLGDWLLAEQRADGSFTPFTGGQDWRDVPADWSTRPGVHQAKIALGLLALARASGDERYAQAALAAVEFALHRQESDGRFVTNPDTGQVNIHPHSYAAEAAWAVGSALGDQELLAAAARATRWVLDVSPPGEVFRVWGPRATASSAVRVDGLAQTLRLSVLTGVGSPAEQAALTTSLLAHQEREGGDRRCGGFRFGYGSDGVELRHVNVWVTAFAVQALLLASDPRPVLDWRYLV